VVDWLNALTIAVTGIVSVFLVLGILSIVVSLSGRYFIRKEKEQPEQSEG
jgi:Na+-transporting methylmalonyl-CoA/oxaloacetate decarboxylase gamma subunit